MLTDTQVRKESAILTELAYGIEPDFDKDGIQVAFFERSRLLYVVFCGSNEARDWLTNFRFWSKRHNGSKYHGGYLKTLKPNIAAISRLISDKNIERLPIVVCGHSAGGAWATLFSCVSGIAPKQIVTFGAPRSIKKASHEVQKFLNARLTNYKNANDMVTKLPWGWRDYGKQVVRWVRRFGSEHPMNVYVAEFFQGE